MIMAPPVECPKQKQGKPGFSATTFSIYDFCMKERQAQMNNVTSAKFL